jgi:hypothetical protein
MVPGFGIKNVSIRHVFCARLDEEIERMADGSSSWQKKQQPASECVVAASVALDGVPTQNEFSHE